MVNGYVAVLPKERRPRNGKDESHPEGSYFIDSDTVAAHSTFAVEQGPGVSPFIVDFDLLEKVLRAAVWA